MNVGVETPDSGQIPEPRLARLHGRVILAWDGVCRGASSDNICQHGLDQGRVRETTSEPSHGGASAHGLSRYGEAEPCSISERAERIVEEPVRPSASSVTDVGVTRRTPGCWGARPPRRPRLRGGASESMIARHDPAARASAAGSPYRRRSYFAENPSLTRVLRVVRVPRRAWCVRAPARLARGGRPNARPGCPAHKRATQGREE
jgi:hypothetical protein